MSTFPCKKCFPFGKHFSYQVFYQVFCSFMLRFIMRISPIMRIATVTAARQSPTGPAYSRPSMPMMPEKMYAQGRK